MPENKVLIKNVGGNNIHVEWSCLKRKRGGYCNLKPKDKVLVEDAVEISVSHSFSFKSGSGNAKISNQGEVVFVEEWTFSMYPHLLRPGETTICPHLTLTSLKEWEKENGPFEEEEE